MLANNRRFMLLPPKVSLCFARLRGLGLRCFCLSGADGAAALLHARARVDGGFPDMAVRALPPRFFVASGGHHLRRQRTVEALMPLSADQRLNGCQVVKALQDLAVRTVGAAAAALHALRNHE